MPHIGNQPIPPGSEAREENEVSPVGIEAEAPAHHLAVSYMWSNLTGSRSGWGVVILTTSFSEIEAHLMSVFGYLRTTLKRENVAFLSTITLTD